MVWRLSFEATRPFGLIVQGCNKLQYWEMWYKILPRLLKSLSATQGHVKLINCSWLWSGTSWVTCSFTAECLCNCQKKSVRKETNGAWTLTNSCEMDNSIRSEESMSLTNVMAPRHLEVVFMTQMYSVMLRSLVWTGCVESLDVIIKVCDCSKTSQLQLVGWSFFSNT